MDKYAGLGRIKLAEMELNRAVLMAMSNENDRARESLEQAKRDIDRALEYLRE